MAGGPEAKKKHMNKDVKGHGCAPLSGNLMTPVTLVSLVRLVNLLKPRWPILMKRGLVKANKDI